MVFWEVFSGVFAASMIAQIAGWIFRKYFEPLLEDGHEQLNETLRSKKK